MDRRLNTAPAVSHREKAPHVAIPRQRDGSNREKVSSFKTSSLRTVIFILVGSKKHIHQANIDIFITMVPMLLWLMTLYPLSLVHATIMMNLWDTGPPLLLFLLAVVAPILTGWQAIAAMRAAPLVMCLSIFTVLNAAY